jgi:hypothetical protein
MLLARGADPNAHIYASGTPLYVAYGKKNTAMIELLERHGGYLDAEMVGWLGLADQARQLLSDEAAGRLRKEAVPDWGEGSQSQSCSSSAASTMRRFCNWRCRT